MNHISHSSLLIINIFANLISSTYYYLFYLLASSISTTYFLEYLKANFRHHVISLIKFKYLLKIRALQCPKTIGSVKNSLI
jgi:hypothetical protein